MQRTLLLTMLGLAVGVIGSGSAQTPPATPPVEFRPGLGDLMTMLVQPRHVKLGLGGREKNWVYAAYELGELQEAHSVRWQRVCGRGIATFALSPTTMQCWLAREPMAALTDAIKNKDAAGFTKAYGALTEACNLCHQSAGKEMVVIQVPQASPYPDQNFLIPKR